MNKHLAINMASMGVWLALVCGAMLALKHSFSAQPTAVQAASIDGLRSMPLNIATLPAQESCKTLMKNMNELHVAIKLVATQDNAQPLRIQLQSLNEKFAQQGCK
jgi:hypothetical protein